MARTFLEDAQGELSQGDGSNKLWDVTPRVGDTATALLRTEAGYVEQDYVVPGVPGIAMSLDGMAYGADGEPLFVGGFGEGGIVLHFRCESVQPGPVRLALPQTAVPGDSNVAVVPVRTDTGVSGDTGSVEAIPLVDVPAGTDAGESADSGAPSGAAPPVDVDAVSDAGVATDSGSASVIEPVSGTAHKLYFPWVPSDGMLEAPPGIGVVSADPNEYAPKSSQMLVVEIVRLDTTDVMRATATGLNKLVLGTVSLGSGADSGVRTGSISVPATSVAANQGIYAHLYGNGHENFYRRIVAGTDIQACSVSVSAKVVWELEPEYQEGYMWHVEAGSDTFIDNVVW